MNVFSDVSFATNPPVIKLHDAIKGQAMRFTYDGKPRDIIVERVGNDFLCGNCKLSGGFRNFRFDKIENLTSG